MSDEGVHPLKIMKIMAALAASAFTLSPMFSAESVLPIEPQLQARALEESAVPVCPGQPGRQPFWNKVAVQFLYAPAFDFPEVPGAARYGFSVAPAKGEPLNFTADKPWAPLSPVWAKVPPGETALKVTALDAQGNPLGAAMTRSFHRAAVIDLAYPCAKMTWRESARTALAALVHSPDLRCWFSEGELNQQFHLYRYPAKIIGAAAAALASYATQTPAPADAAEALKAARRAADYLLKLSEPADSAWAFHPPTYHPTLFRDRLKGHMAPGNYMTQYGAEAGLYFLDVYAATQDAKYLQAADRIAETYIRRQLTNGSWLLFVKARDGSPIVDNVLIPTVVVEFFEQLDKVNRDRRFAAAREKAVQWIVANPVRTWNWQGQFEDVNPQPPYENLTKHDACYFAIYLFNAAPENPTQRGLALDLLRFSEDQFVIWAQPPKRNPTKPSAVADTGAKAKRWMLPCVLEQYRCYEPVCASSAKLIRTYLAAYRVKGDPLLLAKARALGAALTCSQANRTAPGRYLTWLKQPSGSMWFNCELMAVRAMEELAAVDTAPVR